MEIHLVVVYVSAWYNGWHAGPLLQLGLAVTAWQLTKLWGEPTAHRDGLTVLLVSAGRHEAVERTQSAQINDGVECAGPV